MARGVPGSDCIDWRVPGAGVMAVSESGFADQNNGRSLCMPESNRRVEAKGQALARTELKVPAGKPFAMNFQSEGHVSAGYSYSCQQTFRFTLQSEGHVSAGYSYSCQQTFRFTPTAHQNYELILLDSGRCLVALQRLSPRGNL